MHHVAARGEGSEADELDRRFRNKVHRGAEAGGSNMSGMDGCSVGAGDGDWSGKLSGLEEIGESIGDRKRSAGVEHEGCDDRSVGGNSSRILSSRNSQRVVRRFDVTVNRIEFALGWWWDDWIRSWFGSNVGGKEDCLRFLEVNLGRS